MAISQQARRPAAVCTMQANQPSFSPSSVLSKVLCLWYPNEVIQMLLMHLCHMIDWTMPKKLLQWQWVQCYVSTLKPPCRLGLQSQAGHTTVCFWWWSFWVCFGQHNISLLYNFSCAHRLNLYMLWTHRSLCKFQVAVTWGRLTGTRDSWGKVFTVLWKKL